MRAMLGGTANVHASTLTRGSDGGTGASSLIPQLQVNSSFGGAASRPELRVNFDPSVLQPSKAGATREEREIRMAAALEVMAESAKDTNYITSLNSKVAEEERTSTRGTLTSITRHDPRCPSRRHRARSADAGHVRPR